MRDSLKFSGRKLPNIDEVNQIINDSQWLADFDVAIILQSIIERSLQERLKSALPFSTPEIRRRLFGDNGSLDSYSLKIDILSSIEIIHCDVVSDLRLIAKIRNQFAHRVESISFDKNEIYDYCFKLRCNINEFPKYYSHSSICPTANSVETLDFDHSAIFVDKDYRLLLSFKEISVDNKAKEKFLESCRTVWAVLMYSSFFK